MDPTGFLIYLLLLPAAVGALMGAVVGGWLGACAGDRLDHEMGRSISGAFTRLLVGFTCGVVGALLGGLLALSLVWALLA
jgi:hypothetical protein